MNIIPETVPFADAFCAVFAHVVNAGYSMLDQDRDSLDDEDPDEVRVQLSNAIGEAAACFPSLPVSTAELDGALTDIVLERWSDLNEYLIDTTDRE